MKILDTSIKATDTENILITARKKDFELFSDSAETSVVLVDKVNVRKYRDNSESYSRFYYISPRQHRPIDVLGKDMYTQLVLMGVDFEWLVFLRCEV